jgi:hypothetical protein
MMGIQGIACRETSASFWLIMSAKAVLDYNETGGLGKPNGVKTLTEA